MEKDEPSIHLCYRVPWAGDIEVAQDPALFVGLWKRRATLFPQPPGMVCSCIAGLLSSAGCRAVWSRAAGSCSGAY
jgi:hypothetical protein